MKAVKGSKGMAESKKSNGLDDGAEIPHPAKKTGLDHKTVSGAVEASNPTTKPKKSNGLDGDGEIPHTAKKTREKRGASQIKLAPGKTLEEMAREGIGTRPSPARS